MPEKSENISNVPLSKEFLEEIQEGIIKFRNTMIELARVNVRLVVVSDEDSYRTIWLNDERITDSESVCWEEIIQQIELQINSYVSPKMESHFLKMHDMNCSDIPKDVNTLEELLTWYKEKSGGEEMDRDF
jgi:predicted protein tyrosine phosphatase